MVGGDVLLSCQLEPAVDASHMSIEWSRPDLDPSYVYVWWDGEELESSKHPAYEGRTSLLFRQLEFGDVSLKLSNVKPFDKGKYKCFIPTLDQGCTVELVVGIYSFPVISLAGLGRTSSSVELQCESSGWYPEPELLWLDADRNLLSAGPTETVRGPDGFYTVISKVTVEKKHSNKFTCRVHQNNINQSREALIQVTDDFFKVQSSNASTIMGLTVCLTAAFILFILAVLLFIRTRRQNRKKKILVTEKEEEIELAVTMTVEFLKNILNDLHDDQLSKFQRFLQQPNNVQGLPAIKESQLQAAAMCKTVDVMVDTYGLQGTMEMTRVVLEKISRKDLLQRFPASSSRPKERDTEQSIQPQSVQLQDWLLLVRGRLIQQLPDDTVDQILDRLYDQDVISEEDKDVIRAQSSRADKARELVDGVHRKGSKAVSLLLVALHEVEPFLFRNLT